MRRRRDPSSVLGSLRPHAGCASGKNQGGLEKRGSMKVNQKEWQVQRSKPKRCVVKFYPEETGI
jgi:hypothetical protein